MFPFPFELRSKLVPELQTECRNPICCFCGAVARKKKPSNWFNSHNICWWSHHLYSELYTIRLEEYTLNKILLKCFLGFSLSLRPFLSSFKDFRQETIIGFPDLSLLLELEREGQNEWSNFLPEWIHNLYELTLVLLV